MPFVSSFPVEGQCAAPPTAEVGNGAGRRDLRPVALAAGQRAASARLHRTWALRRAKYRVSGGEFFWAQFH